MDVIDRQLDKQQMLEDRIMEFASSQHVPWNIDNLLAFLKMGVRLDIPLRLRALVNDARVIKVYDSGEQSLYVSSEVLSKPAEDKSSEIVHDKEYEAFLDLMNKKQEEKDRKAEEERLAIEAERARKALIARKIQAIEKAFDAIPSPSFPSFSRRYDTAKFVDLKAQVDVIVSIASKASAALKAVNSLLAEFKAENPGTKYSGPQKMIEARSIVTGILSGYSNFKPPDVDVYNKKSIEAALNFINELERWVEYQSIAAGQLVKLFKNKDSVGQYEESQKPKWVYAEASTSFNKTWKIDVREKYVGI